MVDEKESSPGFYGLTESPIGKENSEEEEETQASNKIKRRPRRERKAKQAAADGMIKTNNKLIGSIMNKQLYDSDEEKATTQEDCSSLRMEKLEIEKRVPKEKKELGAIFKKMNSLKMDSKKDIGGSLGLIDSLQRHVSVNELAANGIQISIKNQIMQKFQDAQE